MPWTHRGGTSYVIGLVTKERPADYKLPQTAVVAPSCRLVTAAQVQQPTPAHKVCAHSSSAAFKQTAPSRITPQPPASTRNKQRESQRIALFEAHDPRSVTSRSLLDPAPRLRAAPSRPLPCYLSGLSVRLTVCVLPCPADCRLVSHGGLRRLATGLAPGCALLSTVSSRWVAATL